MRERLEAAELRGSVLVAPEGINLFLAGEPQALRDLVAWLQQERPEVLCLQETKVTDELFPRAAFEALGYQVVISGQKAYNGVAMLSLLPLEDVQVGFDALLPGDPEAPGLSEQKRVISALVDGVRVLNLYVPNGSSLSSEKYAYKLEWLACLQRYLAVQEDQGDPLCMVGDFNIGPEARDIHEGRSENRSIYGEATPAEVRKLAEDGIETAPLPPRPTPAGKMN